MCQPLEKMGGHYTKEILAKGGEERNEYTLGLFMLRSFKSQSDDVMNLSNCYFFGY